MGRFLILVAVLVALVSPAMALDPVRTAITATTAPGAWPTDGTALTLTSADPYNGHYITMTGNDLLVVQNTDGSSHNVSVTSVADPITGRSGTIADDSIAAGAIVIYGPFTSESLRGWRQSDGGLYFGADDSTIKFGVIRIP